MTPYPPLPDPDDPEPDTRSEDVLLGALVLLTTFGVFALFIVNAVRGIL
jgi:hypothetical protein